MEIFFCNFIEIKFGSLITKLNESCTYISNLLVDIFLMFQKKKVSEKMFSNSHKDEMISIKKLYSKVNC
jgi:hypothetical protein